VVSFSQLLRKVRQKELLLGHFFTLFYKFILLPIKTPFTFINLFLELIILTLLFGPILIDGKVGLSILLVGVFSSYLVNLLLLLKLLVYRLDIFLSCKHTVAYLRLVCDRVANVKQLLKRVHPHLVSVLTMLFSFLVAPGRKH